MAGSHARRVMVAAGRTCGRSLRGPTTEAMIDLRGRSAVRPAVFPSPMMLRALAALIVAVPMVLIGQAIDSYEQEVVAKLSNQELREYLKQGSDQSFVAGYLIMAVGSLLYLGALEGVALLVRLGCRMVRPSEARTFAQARSY